VAGVPISPAWTSRPTAVTQRARLVAVTLADLAGHSIGATT
jgi:hypothetical protein